MRTEEVGTSARRRIAATAAVAILGFAGLGAAGCGDDDGEGPIEEAGKAIDEGASDAGNAIDDAANSDEVKEAGQGIEDAANDAGNAIDEGVSDATTDDGK